MLAVSGLGLAVVALAMSGFGLWDEILGDGASATGTFGLAIALYGLSFVPGLAQSALLGANKAYITIVVQAFLAPTMCAGAALAVFLDLDARWVVVVPGLAVLVVALVNALVSARVTKLRLMPLVPKLAFPRRHPGTPIRSIAGPALLVTLTVPITMAKDRLVLSHFSTPQDLANYSVAMQIFAPLMALIPAASQPLWPMFAKARSTGVLTVNLTKVILLFVTMAALGGALLCLVAGPVAKVIGDDQIDLGIALPIAFALMAVVQAIAGPLAMALMYPAGLRVMAALCLLALPINIALSILVAPELGAPGPLYVGIGVGAFVQTLPAIFYARRHRLGMGERDQGRPRPAARRWPRSPPRSADSPESLGAVRSSAAAVGVALGQVGADEEAVGPPHPLVDAVDVGGEERPQHEARRREPAHQLGQQLLALVELQEAQLELDDRPARTAPGRHRRAPPTRGPARRP